MNRRSVISAMIETIGLGNLRPISPFTRKPAKGSSGINQRCRSGGAGHSFIRSTASTFRVFRVRKTAMMIGQPDSGFGGGHDHDEEDKDLPADLMPLVGKGDKGQVDRVQHQLDRHEDGNDVALDEECAHANGE